MNLIENAVPEKIRFWENRLLDLSLRNALINLRPGRSCLPVAAGNGARVDELLSEGRELPLSAWMPEEELPEDIDAFEALEGLKASAFPETEGLALFSEEKAMEAALKRLYRAARTAMDESGTGTLFMGIGMLRWVDIAERVHVAPLALVPVALLRRRGGWALATREGEAELNVTLLEKLKREYETELTELATLPRLAGGGIDLDRVYAAFRTVADGREGWAVLDRSALANFAFGPFVMWNDLRRREGLMMDNPITRSLITGIRMERPEPLEPEGEPFLPLPTDASQLAAVDAARRGESYVLHGPPGTGKSQTITTLIANLLADGRRVLFVAEKQAALEVVRTRLEGLGLGEYCLSLHAGSKGAMEQLKRMLERTEPPEAQGYQEAKANAAALAARLDGLAAATHTPAPCGVDLYTAVQRRVALADAHDLEPLGGDYLDALTPQGLEEARRAIRRLMAAGRAVGHPARFPLRMLGEHSFEASEAEGLSKRLGDYRSALAALGEAQKRLAEKTGWTAPVTQAEHARFTAAVTDAVFWSRTERRELRGLSEQQWIQLMGMVNHCLAARQLRAQLVRGFKPEFFSQDGAALYAEWQELQGNPILGRLKLPGLLRRINGWALKPVPADSVWVPLRALQNLQAEEEAARGDMEKYRGLLGDDWRGEATDWQAVQARLSDMRDHAGRFGSMTWLPPMREKLLGDSESLALAKGAAQALETVNACRAALRISMEKEPVDADWLAGRIARCDAAIAALGKAGEWQNWLRCAAEAREMGLGVVVDAYEAGLEADALPDAYEKALHGELAARIIEGSEELRRFTGRATEALAEEFKALDLEAAALSRAALSRLLYERREALLEEAEQTPDLSRLRRACAGKRPGRGLRYLFEQSPRLMGKLCGCMLMTPVSVAQYLPEGLPDFDAVIFDEASQLLTCRAVGSLSRARSAIVVGDPRQMPPTTFFAAASVEADDPDLEDLESVLDDCMAVGMPSRALLWHYRSRHESLIAFSNRAFYDGKLITFPSADARAPHVRAVRVDGTFERSGRRVNRQEADAVLEELVRRAHSPELSSKSVGVVTFNLAQQNLIEDKVDAAAAQDPVFSAWIDGEGEGLFIKNLENVQGDERDVILFSVGYGPDAEGAVHMNFGPLNRDGGWRRLNVAVTRAREEMLLFTSMSPEDIRVGGTTPRGVSALREFMAYALEGGELPGQADQTSAPDGIAEALAVGLAEAGWATQRNVGRSDRRVSLAVIDPEDPQRYRLGILLDDTGAGDNARDREVGYENVLRALGWQLIRVYALDWRRNPSGELDRVLEHLK